MNLQNGKYYTTADGTVVKAQLEADGHLHCYDAKGSEVTKVKAAGHVEGWRPVGRAEYQKARKAVTSQRKEGKSIPKEGKLKASAKLETKTTEKNVAKNEAKKDKKK